MHNSILIDGKEIGENIYSVYRLYTVYTQYEKTLKGINTDLFLEKKRVSRRAFFENIRLFVVCIQMSSEPLPINIEQNSVNPTVEHSKDYAQFYEVIRTASSNYFIRYDVRNH